MLVRLLGNSVLSNENFEIEKNIIYPNPARELIYISNISNVEYEIFDMLGESILKSISNGNQINVNSITKGIYILSLKNDNKIINQKFIKE